MRGTGGWVPVVVLASTLAGLEVGTAPAVARPPARPNVLVILTDDQRLGTLGAMPATTRAFRRNGTEFRNAFVTTPLCCPSRATLFTGQYAHNHGVRSNGDEAAGRLHQRRTVQRYLDDAGYRTGIFGKYLNGWNLHRKPPHFDRWAVFSRGLARGYSGGMWDVQGTVRRVDRYSTDFIRSRAVRFLKEGERADGKPWFLHLSVWAPHTPTVPAAKHRAAPVGAWHGNPAVRERDRSDKPSWVRERHLGLDKARRTRRGQLRTLLSVDDLVARVLGRLRALGEGRDTLVLFTSDNGFLWGEHGLKGKTSPYGRSISVPMFLRWPGRLPPGRTDDRIVANVDIAPTILAAAGIQASHRLDGRSLLDPSWRRDRLVTEFWRLTGHFMPTWASVRTAGIQYIEYYDAQGIPVVREYYDLARDPSQLRNLLGTRTPADDPPAHEIVALSARLARDRRCQGTAGPTACP